MFDLLRGIRVLDLTQLLPGPYCTALLADLGAEVISIERREGGDPARSLSPSVFWSASRNKRRVALDLSLAEGREVVLRLAEHADVLVEGFRPGVMQRLSLGPEVLRTIAPRLIFCSISGYGHTGANRDVPGHDLNYLATAGILDVPVDALDTPPGVPIPIGDLSAGSLAAVTILAALHRLQGDPSAVGCTIDIGIADVVTTWASVRDMSGGAEPGPPSNRLAGNGVFECSDGLRIAVAALEEKFWDALVDLLDLRVPEGANGIRTTQQRFEHRIALSEQIQDRLRRAPRATWLERFDALDVPASPVLSVAEALASEQAAGRGYFRSVAEDGIPRGYQATLPAVIEAAARSEDWVRGHGVDTVEVLQEVGFNDDDLDRLRKVGAL